jgi:hypothetical protein
MKRSTKTRGMCIMSVSCGDVETCLCPHRCRRTQATASAVGGAHKIMRESFRANVFAASALDGVVKTTDDDAPRPAHGHSPSQQPPTGRQGRPDGSSQDAMRALHVGLCAEPHHTENRGHGPPSRVRMAPVRSPLTGGHMGGEPTGATTAITRRTWSAARASPSCCH